MTDKMVIFKSEVFIFFIQKYRRSDAGNNTSNESSSKAQGST